MTDKCTQAYNQDAFQLWLPCHNMELIMDHENMSSRSTFIVMQYCHHSCVNVIFLSQIYKKYIYKSNSLYWNCWRLIALFSVLCQVWAHCLIFRFFETIDEIREITALCSRLKKKSQFPLHLNSLLYFSLYLWTVYTTIRKFGGTNIIKKNHIW